MKLPSGPAPSSKVPYGDWAGTATSPGYLKKVFIAVLEYMSSGAFQFVQSLLLLSTQINLATGLVLQSHLRSACNTMRCGCYKANRRCTVHCHPKGIGNANCINNQEIDNMKRWSMIVKC